MTSIWVGERVRLRGFEPEDWEASKRFDEDTADQRSGWRVWPPASAASYREWALEEAKKKPDGDEFRLAIARLEDDVLVGSVSVNRVDRSARCFAYGIAIGREHHRKGYAREAVQLLLRYMFDECDYQKAEAHVFGYNAASCALQLSLGLVEEGRLRRHKFAAGRFHDEVLFGITVEEFRERYPSLAIQLP